MKDFKIQQAILKQLNKNSNIKYCNANSQQLEIKVEDGEVVVKQGNYGYWLVFGKNAYRIDENNMYINLEKLNPLEDTKKIDEIEQAFNFSIEGLTNLDKPKICIKAEKTTYVMFLENENKYFVEEKDLKILENNYKDYQYKLCEIEDDRYVLAISIEKEIVAIFMDNKVEEVDLIGGKKDSKYKDN